MGLGANILVNGTAAEDLMATGVVQYIEIFERLGETTYYNMHFCVDIANDDIAMLSDPRLSPGGMLTITVQNDTVVDCLVQGPVFSHEIVLKNGGHGSTLMVKGGDSTIKMDREFKSVVYEGTDNTAVNTIVSSYGLTPDVTATNANHEEAKHSLVQRCSDLQFVKMLARRNGFKFWITVDSTGVETAHFKRPSLDGEAAAELKINRPDFNVNEMTLSWDALRPSKAQGLQLDLANKSNIVGSVTTAPQTALGSTTQQAFATDLVTIDLSAPVDDSGDLTARLEAAMVEANFFVQASLKTSVQQLHKVLRPATLVTVTGAGSQHSGKYLVGAVHHRIDESAHTMEIELMRNAIGPSA